MKRARAREMRILQPPLNDLVGRSCMAGSKPRPDKIRAARAYEYQRTEQQWCLGANRRGRCKSVGGVC